MLELNKVHLGDNMQLIKQIPNNTVDSIVTDPPYGISFMNKKWDYDVPSVEFWKEAYRVLKPGGHILVACGTRTQHRMAVNIEDAGFEIRDIVAWIYGSGFPKSLDISKAIDKTLGAEREVMADSTDRRGDKTIYGLGHSGKITSNEPITDQAKQWQGFGTSLKPAMECFTLARKPIEGTVANNVLKWGCGGLNIDGCRIPLAGEWDKSTMGTFRKAYDDPNKTYDGTKGNIAFGGNKLRANREVVEEFGRFPANVIHDGSEEVVALFPDTNPSKATYRGLQNSGRHGGYGDIGSNLKDGTNTIRGIDDNGGSAARFFYTSKASQSERNEGLWGFEEKTVGSLQGGESDKELLDDVSERFRTTKRNFHPTVKPLDLMQYLCRLITPRGGLVLEPFAGSGTTCIACKLERMNFIGMEIDADYVKIAEARIKAADVQYDIFDFL